MKHLTIKITEIGRIFGFDTALVLFFLALEYGRAVQIVSLDGLLMGTTMVMVLALPYFLPSKYAQPHFSAWLVGRAVVALLGITLGYAFGRGLGVVVPESLRLLPLTLLIVASMISAYVQFYGLLKLRLAK